MKKYLAEGLGAGTLALVVGLSLRSTFPVPTAVLAGLVLMLFVYTIGSLSGSHINPAVTIGAWSIGKISATDALMYVISQCIGGGIAYAALSATGGLAVLTVTNSLSIAAAELVGTFFFTFGIASVIYGKAPSAASGIVIGGSLLLGITIAAIFGSNGVLNPAVAIGIGSFNLAYLLGPIVGSFLGMQAYKYLAH